MFTKLEILMEGTRPNSFELIVRASLGFVWWRGVVLVVAPKAGARAVCVHQAGNEDSEEEDTQDGFDDRERAGVRGDRRDSRSAQRR